MIILGVDPGLANTGWGIVETEAGRSRCLAYGCIRTSGSKDMAHRCKSIRDGLAGLIARYSPAEAAIENVYFSRNVSTAMATGHARGAALVAMADAGIQPGEYGPGEIKLAVVGTGSADKKQVTYMVRAVLGLDHDPTPDHAADALAAAICHANHRSVRAHGSPGATPKGAAR